MDQVASALEAYLGDYQQWLNWLAAGVIQGIDSAGQVGEVLGTTFSVGYDAIATSTQQTLKYTTDQVTSALEGAGASADDAATVLVNTLGCSADAAADAVADVFDGEHCDVTITPHSDTTLTPHSDSSSHSDIVSTPHSDSTMTPHSDSKTHWDAGALGSSKTHADIPSSHADIPKVHADLGTTHADIPKTHADIPAIHTTWRRKESHDPRTSSHGCSLQSGLSVLLPESPTGGRKPASSLRLGEDQGGGGTDRLLHPVWRGASADAVRRPGAPVLLGSRKVRRQWNPDQWRSDRRSAISTCSAAARYRWGSPSTAPVP